MSRLEETNLELDSKLVVITDFSEQEIGTSRLKLNFPQQYIFQKYSYLSYPDLQVNLCLRMLL